MDRPSRISAPVALLALGVVFGDIGTSPLYAFRMCFSPEVGLTPDRAAVLGVTCLIFWSLTVVISLKYLAYLLRADLYGEGGILALMTLANASEGKNRFVPIGVFVLGMFGAALLYGDGMITPAISVLSAVEGLGVATSALNRLVVPITVGILWGLFALQRRGTERVGRLFGPVMLVWFLVLIILGLRWILQAPEILLAVDPRHGFRLLVDNPVHAFRVLGFIFLVVTGGEALYADLGHFGKRGIRQAWFFAVFPAVGINYFGQGALLLVQPDSIKHTFFDLAPDWSLFPLVALATCAAVIASQAVITGAFSLTYQCFRLGYAPRLDVRHYADDGEGQVYVPWVNWALLVMSVLLVVSFGSSDALANAYGVAVATTMVITTFLACVYFSRRWGWAAATAVTSGLLVFDLPFFLANIVKVPEGGWVPLAVSVLIFGILTTWKKGRRLELNRVEALRSSEDQWLESMAENPPARVHGTAVFFDPETSGIPRTMIRNLIHNRVLHEHVVIFSVVTEAIPRVPSERRTEVIRLMSTAIRVNAHYGYMQQPNVPSVLGNLDIEGFDYDPDTTTFFVGSNDLVVTPARGMTRWRKRLYAFLSRNALDATQTYRVPVRRMVSLGARVKL